MRDQNGNDQFRSPRVKRTTKMLKQLPGEFDPMEFTGTLDQETIRELDPEQASFEYTVPAFVYGPSNEEPEVVLWPLSLN